MWSCGDSRRAGGASEDGVVGWRNAQHTVAWAAAERNQRLVVGASVELGSAGVDAMVGVTGEADGARDVVAGGGGAMYRGPFCPQPASPSRPMHKTSPIPFVVRAFGAGSTCLSPQTAVWRLAPKISFHFSITEL
jgi:hypothetical protein